MVRLYTVAFILWNPTAIALQPHFKRPHFKLHGLYFGTHLKCGNPAFEHKRNKKCLFVTSPQMNPTTKKLKFINRSMLKVGLNFNMCEI